VRARFIPFALIVALSLAACDGSGSGHDTGSAPPPSPVTSPITSPDPGSTSIAHSGPPQATVPPLPSDVPTTGPNLVRKGEKPPRMPLEATQHTQAGATAFAQFFIHTIDWAYATVDASYMKHYASASCGACGTFSDGIEKARALGHRYIGGRFTVRSASPGASSGTDARATVLLDITGFQEVDQKDGFVRGQAPQRGLRFAVDLKWEAGGWSVSEMRVGA
jgi:hypothetical protein